ncbi:MAG TPA: hypothetical protein VMR45_04355 [Patescibacteria group bacterium]|nr:hypothetical protein [Patescibacteria group bacterium]
MSNSDKLQITYDSAAGDPTYGSDGHIVGNVAASTTDSGNPVKVGGKYNASVPTLTDGQRGDLQLDNSGNIRITQATALSQSIDSILTYPRGSNYTALTASGIVLSSAGKLTGIWISNSSATPTLKIWDNTSASGNVLIDTFTPTPGVMYSFPNVRVTIGLYATIGGTVSCTVFYDPTTT